MNKQFKMKTIIRMFVVMLIATAFAQCSTNIKNEKTMNTQENKNLKQIIVDVRTPDEWQMDGHAVCSVNYPLDKFQTKIEELKNYDKVIIVCRSGNRAGIAKQQLVSAGYTKEVENLGPWQNVSCAN
jgi:phage shock protein E